MSFSIRRATALDEPAIRDMVRGERLNPTGLNWPNFLVAVSGSAVVGAVQMRNHRDGARELGSLVVHHDSRRQGIATRMIDALLVMEHGTVWMITDEAFAYRYASWGFRRAAVRAAPRTILLNYVMGRMAFIISLIKRRPFRRLVILERPVPPPHDLSDSDRSTRFYEFTAAA